MFRGCLFAACAMLGLVSSAPEVPVHKALDQRLALVGEALDQHLAAQDKSVHSLHAGWKMSGAVWTFNPKYTMYDTQMTTSSGCGAHDQKCKCTIEEDGKTMKMEGQGTSGTWTGLTFTCGFKIKNSDNVQCHIHVNIPYAGSNNYDCSCNDGAFNLTGGVCDGGHETGHFFVNQAFTLTTPATDQALALNHRRLATLNDNVRSLNAGWHYDAMIRLGSGMDDITIASAERRDMESGCGNDNSKCSCNVQGGSKDVSMAGTGTSGTWTGLTFTCELFTSTNVDCHVRVNIPYAGSNSIECECDHPDYTLTGCDLPGGGHYFSDRALTINRKLPVTVQPFTNVGFTWSYIGANSGFAITSTRSTSQADGTSFTASLTEGLKIAQKGQGGVPFVASGETSVELSVSATQAYGNSMTKTTMQTEAVTCSNKCERDEVTYQWKLTAKDQDKFVWVTRCEFACIPMAYNVKPKCPAYQCANAACQCCNSIFWEKDEDSLALRALLNEHAKDFDGTTNAGGTCKFP